MWCRSLWNSPLPRWQLRTGAGVCLARRGKGLEFAAWSGGSLGAPRPGCAGAPSQFESSGGAEWIQQPSPGAGTGPRRPPPPRRALLPSRRRPRRRPPAPPPPPRRPPLPPRGPAARSDSSRGGCRARLLPFPSCLLSLTATSSHPLPPAICKAPPVPGASRCQEVSRGQRISGQRISSPRIAAAARPPAPREGAPAEEAAPRDPVGGDPGCSRPPARPHPTPRTRNPPRGRTSWKLSRQRAAG